MEEKEFETWGEKMNEVMGGRGQERAVWREKRHIITKGAVEKGGRARGEVVNRS